MKDKQNKDKKNKNEPEIINRLTVKLTNESITLADSAGIIAVWHISAWKENPEMVFLIVQTLGLAFTNGSLVARQYIAQVFQQPQTPEAEQLDASNLQELPREETLQSDYATFLRFMQSMGYGPGTDPNPHRATHSPNYPGYPAFSNSSPMPLPHATAKAKNKDKKRHKKHKNKDKGIQHQPAQPAPGGFDDPLPPPLPGFEPLG